MSKMRSLKTLWHVLDEPTSMDGNEDAIGVVYDYLSCEICAVELAERDR